MRLVFVHGMRQEGKDPLALKLEWEKALRNVWQREGLAVPTYRLEMPFYGNTLNELTEAVRGSAGAVVARGAGNAGTFSPVEEQIIRAMAARAGITDAEVNADLGQEVVTRGVANWEWVQGLARVLERRVPGLGRLGLGFVRQVDAYLTRPHIRRAVDEIVLPALGGGPQVVVAHSLGTIVTYTLLRKLGANASVPLYATLGSPLGIDAVKMHIRPPKLMVPEGVAHWLNGTDERDYVALHARLDRNTFAEGIENLSDMRNRDEDAHAIVDYLADATVCRRIHAALATG